MTATPTAKNPTQAQRAQIFRQKRLNKTKNSTPYVGCPDGQPHHLVYPTPSAALIVGVCKRCGFHSQPHEAYEPDSWIYDSGNGTGTNKG